MQDRLRTRVYDDGGLIVVVRVMPHQGAWEGHVQGEAVQVDFFLRESARDVQMLNWRKGTTGEPRATETGMRGSERDGGKRSSNGTSPAVYSTVRATTSVQESGSAAKPPMATRTYGPCSVNWPG